MMEKRTVKLLVPLSLTERVVPSRATPASSRTVALDGRGKRRCAREAGASHRSPYPQQGTGQKKGHSRRSGPKSREETPKKGCVTATPSRSRTAEIGYRSAACNWSQAVQTCISGLAMPYPHSLMSWLTVLWASGPAVMSDQALDLGQRDGAGRPLGGMRAVRPPDQLAAVADRPGEATGVMPARPDLDRIEMPVIRTHAGNVRDRGVPG